MATILIVEDEPSIAELIAFTLKEAGWTTFVVSTAAAAWEFVQQRTPQLVVLDWMLPDGTGLHLLSKIRADRQLQQISVIMLTAKSMEEDKLAGLDNGADDYITKPFSPRELTARIKALMRRDFIANASHELRTPLTVINGFLEIALAQPNLDPKVRQSHLQLMTEQGKRMQGLIGDMLTLTRLESIDYPMRPERVHIKPLLEGILEEANALSNGRHRITLAIDGPDLKGSVDELRSAFSNLVSNAVRYTPDGGEINLHWQQNDKGLVFSVQDNGIGIAAEDIARLTERFYRVDKGRSRETQGTGLGLAIVKHVLLRHHATLVIESKQEQGSRFMAVFPASATI